MDYLVSIDKKLLFSRNLHVGLSFLQTRSAFGRILRVWRSKEINVRSACVAANREQTDMPAVILEATVGF